MESECVLRTPSTLSPLVFLFIRIDMARHWLERDVGNSKLMPRPDIYCKRKRWKRRKSASKIKRETAFLEIPLVELDGLIFRRNNVNSNSPAQHLKVTSNFIKLIELQFQLGIAQCTLHTYLKRIWIGYLPPCPFQAVAPFHLSEEPLVFRLPFDGCQRCQTKFDRMERKARQDQSIWTARFLFFSSSRFEQLYKHSQRNPNTYHSIRPN